MATIELDRLPLEIELNNAVRQCYSEEITLIMAALDSNQSVLVECDKLIINHLLVAIRQNNRSRTNPIEMEIIDHRRGDAGPTTNAADAFTESVRQLSQKISELDCGSCAVIVPNFDLLVSSDQSNIHLDLISRDLMAVLYENPDLLLIAFKDPNLNLPKPVMSFFPKQIEIIGIKRKFLPSLITQSEARRINTGLFDPYCLYKYVSGLNVVKLRQILSGFTSSRYVDNSGQEILNEIRKATLTDSQAELPTTSMDDIGGYDQVKKVLKEEVLGLMQFIQEQAAVADSNQISAYEKLIPRNILFTGPPGTGKTMFCKALAAELNATIFIVNGPELKSKWVGESEKAVRKIFSRARKCAPSLIVFDEIDSFTRQRGGAGPDHSANSHDDSMLNQLLTEMDGFRSEETVFVIATTNLSESLDTALLSRFKYRIEIPYPDATDRRQIMQHYNEKYSLSLTDEVVDSIITETEIWIDQNKWTRFAGRDLESLAASLARYKLIQGFGHKKDAGDIQITPALALGEIRKKIITAPIETRFSDIGGYEEVKEKLLNEILKVLQTTRGLCASDRIRIEKLIPKGIIFEGPPGTGKTMFAKALANELDATVSVVNGPELKGSYVGESEKRIREIFSQARKNAPSVIVFDEIDSIAAERSGAIPGGHERSMVNQLLTEMDGIGDKGLVFVVATTNFAKTLDRAFKRPGRFEYIISIPYPDEDARRKIIEIYNRKYRLELDDAAVDHLVFRTDNWVDPQAGIRFSGDRIEAVCRGIARKKLLLPQWQPVRDNLDAVIAQRTKKPLDISREEELVIATHEAGHAIISRHIKGCRPIKRISIASEYDGSLGYVLHEAVSNKVIENQEEILAGICCLLGGRMAEKLLIGKIATGGANDIEKATLMATHLVTVFGYDEEIGTKLVMHPMIHGQKAFGSTSPELLRKVELGVDKILKIQEQRAFDCITEHKEKLMALRDQLIRDKVVEP